MKQIIWILLGLFTFGCSSSPYIPKSDDVVVKKEAPSEKCTELGPVRGRVGTVTGTIEQATEDIKKEAATKGANYVRFEQASAYGTELTGTAYKCP